MQRRQFLVTVPLAAAGLTGPKVIRGRELHALDEDSTQKNKNLLDKVKNAMLSMQRATWEQGVAMQALLEQGESDLVILMAKDAVLRQSDDGRLSMLGEEFALSDAACPGEAVHWAARKTGDKTLQAGFDKMLEYVLHKAPRTKDGILYHFTNIPQIWSDILYMLPPFLAVAGEFHEAMMQIEGERAHLWNPEKKLLSHMWDDGKQALVRKDCWGVGNGWAAAGLSRVIRMLPATMERERSTLIGYATAILDGCIAHQRDDGLFHNIVDNPDTFVETNLAQMLAYTIYRGTKAGWLDGHYRACADRMRAAVHAKVDDLGLVQGVCGSPEFDHPGTATEGQAFFLMMEAAYADRVN
ncbi:MAG TPA: glycoside hydrolase family 88 protein [Bacteroidota bacterium]|nr:glycoside hydrolase family 88 protein [Bacteroidota bacterium]